jgi:RNA 2',3'-cyclic 3'-phosphodiesterase
VRLFVAVALPDFVTEMVAALPRPDRPGVRWTTRDQWHVTVRFLGASPPDEVVPAARGALDLVGEAPIIASLGPASAWFPGRRVLQVPVAGLDRLATAVARVTEAWGQEDDRPFSGHLTLARTAGRRRGPPDLAGTPVSARFPVTEFGVYSSRPGPGGPVYEVLSVARLAPPAGGGA